IDELE
ncbi:hypothetical protein A2U01_0116847, partial [Trifolium medium]